MNKRVLIMMGSDSDWPKMQATVVLLKQLNIETAVHICSAHRTPEKAHEMASTAREQGFGVIIAAAGMAAHLAGVVAAKTTLPVIGVPLSGGLAGGLDALYATVQMPSGIPVATVAVDGAVNAAWLAAQMLAISDPQITSLLVKAKTDMAIKVGEKDANLQTQLA